ncbi:hypothetical protein PENTCL1PPCAC_22241, partial [Pristionchus entomophagus]
DMSHLESSGDRSSKRVKLERKKPYVFVCDESHCINVYDLHGRKIASKDSREPSRDDEEYEEMEESDKMKIDLEVLTKDTHFKESELAIPEKTYGDYFPGGVQYFDNVYLSETGRMDAIDLMKDVDADELRIFFDDDQEDEIDWDNPVELATLSDMTYASLLATCEKRKKVKIEFILDSISAGEWREREGMLSRRLSLESLHVELYKEGANEFLAELFGIKFMRKKLENTVKFFSREEGKKVLCDEKNGDFSIHFFDGLLRTEIYGFR